MKKRREIEKISSIIKVVIMYYDVPADIFHSKSRKREIVQARQVAMYFSQTLTKSSIYAIGEQIGGRDHATVLYACKVVSNLLDIDRRFKFELDEMKSIIMSMDVFNSNKLMNETINRKSDSEIIEKILYIESMLNDKIDELKDSENQIIDTHKINLLKTEANTLRWSLGLAELISNDYDRNE